MVIYRGRATDSAGIFGRLRACCRDVEERTRGTEDKTERERPRLKSNV